MKEFESETIVVKKDAWMFLWNYERILKGYKEVTEEQLNRIWNKIPFLNGDASKDKFPILENEIRIDKNNFGFEMEKIKDVLTQNGFDFREDGYKARYSYL